MGTFYAHIDPVDLEERAARAAADKEVYRSRLGNGIAFHWNTVAAWISRRWLSKRKSTRAAWNHR